MFVYFFLNNLGETYGLGVFPKWCQRRRDKRSNFTQAEADMDIPNTKRRSQSQLEKVYDADQFNVTMRYIYYFITLSCMLMFSGQIFICYPTAMFVFLGIFLSDKYLLL